MQLHPWFGVSVLERVRRWPLFNEWLEQHPDLRIRHGEIRADGRVFLGYGYGYKNGEHWTTRENFERQAERNRANSLKQRQKPGFKERFNEYVKTTYPNKEMRLEKARLRGEAWRKANPERMCEQSRRRKTVIKSRIHPEIDLGKVREFKLEAARLTKETGQEHHVDHIIPFAHGGWHHHENLQVMPDDVHFAKSANPLWQSPGYKSWRDVPRHLWPEQMVETYAKLALDKAS